MPWCCVQTAAVTDWRAGFHLFGYNDKTPWSADSSRMLGLRTALSPRDLGPGDSAQIGLIPFSKGGYAKGWQLQCVCGHMCVITRWGCRSQLQAP